MGKSIVVLSGSPRKGGNTDLLVEAFASGALENGNTVTVLRVADMNIGACLGCNHCFEEKGVCVQKDDMPEILNKIREADAVVFASPVFYFNISTQLKAAIDRFYSTIPLGMSSKQSALLMTSGDTASQVTEPAINMFRQICNFQKWEEVGMILAGGLHEPGEFEGRPEQEQAKALGKKF